MVSEEVVLCPNNAAARNGKVDYLTCRRQCPEFSRAKNLQEGVVYDKQAKRIVQQGSRRDDRFPDCINPWL